MVFDNKTNMIWSSHTYITLIAVSPEYFNVETACSMYVQSDVLSAAGLTSLHGRSDTVQK